MCPVKEADVACEKNVCALTFHFKKKPLVDTLLLFLINHMNQNYCCNLSKQSGK